MELEFYGKGLVELDKYGLIGLVGRE
jgi:hypothetical protein